MTPNFKTLTCLLPWNKFYTQKSAKERPFLINTDLHCSGWGSRILASTRATLQESTSRWQKLNIYWCSILRPKRHTFLDAKFFQDFSYTNLLSLRPNPNFVRNRIRHHKNRRVLKLRSFETKTSHSGTGQYMHRESQKTLDLEYVDQKFSSLG